MTKFLLIGLSLLLFVFSGCQAEKEPNSTVKPIPPPIVSGLKKYPSSVAEATSLPMENAKKASKRTAPSGDKSENVPNSVVKQTPPDDKKGDQVTPNTTWRGVIKTPSTEIEKTLKRARDTDDNGAEPAYEQPECEGIPSNVSVRVLNFLTCKVAQILSKPERVESFLLKPDADTSVPLSNRLGQFPIKAGGQGLNLEGENLEKFQKLVFSEDSYHFGMKKRCYFSPDVGLHFVVGNESVEVLFSFDCDLWLFVFGEEEKLEDFDPIQSQLTTFFNPLFPMSETPETPTETTPDDATETPETPETPTETTPDDPTETPESSVQTSIYYF